MKGHWRVKRKLPEGVISPPSHADLSWEGGGADADSRTELIHAPLPSSRSISFEVDLVSFPVSDLAVVRVGVRRCSGSVQPACSVTFDSSGPPLVPVMDAVAVLEQMGGGC